MHSTDTMNYTAYVLRITNAVEKICISIHRLLLHSSVKLLASSAGGPGFNPQSRTAPYQRRYKNGTSSSLN